MLPSGCLSDMAGKSPGHSSLVLLVCHCWLVVDLPLWKVWVRQLGLGSLFPTEWKVIKFMFQTTNQILSGSNVIFGVRYFGSVFTHRVDCRCPVPAPISHMNTRVPLLFGPPPGVICVTPFLQWLSNPVAENTRQVRSQHHSSKPQRKAHEIP